MVNPRDLAPSLLALSAGASAFSFCPPVRSGNIVTSNLCRRIETSNSVCEGYSNDGCCHRGAGNLRSMGYRRRRVSTAVAMVSDREEELKSKIAKLRGVASKGDTYERVVGKGSDLTDKMESSKGEFESDVEKAEQEKFRDNMVVKGKREDAVSELEAGRRTIVRDPDDPRQESNILDSLMISKEEDLEEELRRAYMPGDSALNEDRERKRKFDGGYATTMQGAEAFFNKPSPFQKAAQEKAAQEKSAPSSASDGREGTNATLSDTNPEASEASLRVTGSVGGRWEKPKDGTDVDTHKPVVTTWGVFERPKDMSKAFGGGRDPTLKKADPEEARRRDEETQAILRSYRGSTGEDLKKEKEHEVEIQAALDQSKRAMRFGDTFGAVSALESVKQKCSTHGPLGAVVFLELAMALEATGRSYQAQDVYKVLRRSRNRVVRAQAKRLNEGLEAMDMLKFGRPGEVNEESEISKMWTTNYQQMSGSDVKKYDSVFFEKDADGKPKGANVFAVEDAKQVLMFATKYRGAISSSRVINAFDFLRKRSEEASLAAQREARALEREAQKAATLGDVTEADNALAETDSPSDAEATDKEREEAESGSLGMKRPGPSWGFSAEQESPQGGAGLVSLLGDVASLEERIQGGWNVAIKAGGSKVEVLGQESSFILAAGGRVTTVEPAGLLSVAKEGQWALDSTDHVVKLDYTSTKWVGLVDVGGGQENLEVLAVDDKLLVASETRRLASANGAEATQTGAVKYRLLLRQ